VALRLANRSTTRIADECARARARTQRLGSTGMLSTTRLVRDLGGSGRLRAQLWVNIVVDLASMVAATVSTGPKQLL
jgi:hypothetical protein